MHDPLSGIIALHGMDNGEHDANVDIALMSTD